MRRTLTALLTLLLATSCSEGQEQRQPAPQQPAQQVQPPTLNQSKPSPCAGPQYKEFDFWLGDWEVRSPSGQLLGRNRITKRHGGCVVLEEWESASGGSGSSFNVYDQPTKQWHQFWVDSSGTNWLSSDKQGNPVTLRGGIRDGVMVMTSHPDTLPSIGSTRATWRPLPDGGLQQTFESSSDGGKTWTVSFDGFYKKAKT